MNAITQRLHQIYSNTDTTEITNERDRFPSIWHQNLPKDFTCTDLDFIETYHNNIVAICEWKKMNAKEKEWQNKQYLTIADALNVPFFVIFYHASSLSFNVKAKNQPAITMLNGEMVKYDENEFIALQYKMRGLTL